MNIMRKKITLIIVIFCCFGVFPQGLNPVPVKEGTKFFYKSSYPFKVNSVAVAGSMNNWRKDADRMIFNPADSIWSTVIKLAEGIEYSYKLVINDSLWITDPNAPNVTEDEWKNGLIVPQKYGSPFVEKAFPAPGQRLNYVPKIKILLKGTESQIDPASVSVKFNGAPWKFTLVESELTVLPDKKLKDGEHKLEISFADRNGNRNDNYTLKFFLDRYIKKITTPKFYDGAVMYEIYIRSFADGNNDGIGDFRGLTSKLDYLKNSLGVNTLWLMPFNESTTEHGYNVVDYYSIEKDYGTFDDYQNFLKEAKKRGMKVLMDFVINHTDSTHKFFLDAYKNPDSKYSKWYQFVAKDNSDWKHFGVERKMPKLDFENSEVQDYFIKAARYWIDPNGDGDFRDGVDGFRCDAAKEVPHQFWNRFRKEIKGINKNILLLGEVWDNANFLIPFYKDEFDMLFDYPFYYALDRYFQYNDINTLSSKVTELKKIYPAGFQSVRFLANHDNNRAYDKLSDENKLKQAMFIIMTMPGTPMIYYGDETGLRGKLPPENVRQKMDWAAADEQLKDKESILSFYNGLTALRNKYSILSKRDDGQKESLVFLNDEAKKILAYLRYYGDKKFIALVNNSGRSIDSIKLNSSKIIKQISSIDEVYSSSKTKNKISFNINKDYIFLNNLNMSNGSFKLIELK